MKEKWRNGNGEEEWLSWLGVGNSEIQLRGLVFCLLTWILLPCVHPGMAGHGKRGKQRLDLTPAGKWGLQGSAAGNNHGLLSSCLSSERKGTAEFPALDHRSNKG